MSKKLALIACLLGLGMNTIACSTTSSKGTEDASAQGGDGSASCATVAATYDPKIDPADFSTTIDNPYYPLPPGSVQKTIDSDGNTTQIVVTSEKKQILGVTTVVVHDYAIGADDLLLEDTFDYFAQDKSGNVWYFGEATKAYSGASLSGAGSWIGGVDCARPGIVMEAKPKVGDSYRQEYLPGSAEDKADVLALDETVTVAYGTFDHCLKTKDYTDLEPGKAENKWYCPGLGNVLTIDLVAVGMGPREELVAVNGMTGDAGKPDSGK